MQYFFECLSLRRNVCSTQICESQPSRFHPIVVARQAVAADGGAEQLKARGMGLTHRSSNHPQRQQDRYQHG